nr:hypothetical protein BgiMline_030773 [Biomphalaria glabrata]
MFNARMPKLKSTMTYLQTLTTMEYVIDHHIDRLESACDWDMKRYVYLQALECDGFLLDRLEQKMNTNQNLIQFYKTLLKIAYRERNNLLAIIQKHHDQLLDKSKTLQANVHPEKAEHKPLYDSDCHCQLAAKCQQEMPPLITTVSLPAFSSDEILNASKTKYELRTLQHCARSNKRKKSMKHLIFQTRPKRTLRNPNSFEMEDHS